MKAAVEEAVNPQPSLAAELREDFWTSKRKKLQIAAPAANTRAGTIGHECDRFIFYERSGKYSELRAPATPERQCLFDLGNMVESYVLSVLEHDMGIEIVQRQRDYVDQRYQISGRLDAKLRRRTWPRGGVPSEIKGLNPWLGSKLITLDDIRNHPDAWVRRYYAQLQCYLFLSAEERGLFVLFNKSNGQIEFVDCPLDYEYAEGLLQRAERVRDFLAKDELPPRRLSSDCERCDFRAPCAPDLDYGAGVVVFDEPALEKLIARRLELAEAKREFDAIDRKLKKKLPEVAQLMVGKFIVAGTPRVRAGYVVAATEYLERDYSEIKGTDQTLQEDLQASVTTAKEK